MTKTKQNNTKRLRRKKQQAQQKVDPAGATSSVSKDDRTTPSKAKVRNRRGRAKGSQVTQKVKRTETVKGRLQESYHEKADQVVSVHGHAMEKGDVFKIIGLGIFFVLMVIIVIALWPMLKTLGEPDGLTRVIAIYTLSLHDALPIWFCPDCCCVYSRRSGSGCRRYDVWTLVGSSYHFPRVRHFKRVYFRGGSSFGRSLCAVDGADQIHGKVSQLRKNRQAEFYCLLAFLYSWSAKRRFYLFSAAD